MEKYAVTDSMIRLVTLCNTLKDYLPDILNQKWYQRRVPMSEKITFISTLADSRDALWKEIYRVYPQLKDKNASVNTTEIIVVE